MEVKSRLNNPPVVAALFQMIFYSSELNLEDYLKFDSKIKQIFPSRTDNIHVGLDLGSTSIPLGTSKISGTSDAKLASYVYQSSDQKIKLELSKDKLTLIDENDYSGWMNFKEVSLSIIKMVSDVLKSAEITRVSIRFINRFLFDNFDNPQEYFNTLISSSEKSDMPYPIRKYGFRLTMDVPDLSAHVVVNQNVENLKENEFIYTFDIDALSRQSFQFDIDTISETMEKLRTIKNEIFFSNLTEKTINLCS